MTQNAQTRKLPGGTVPAPAAQKTGAVDSVLERLWHFLTSMKLAIILLLVLAVAAIAGALVIQAPPGVADDPQARAEWLAGVRPRWGALTDPMATLGIFWIFSTIWFRLLVALLTASLIACTVQRIPGTWRTMTKPHVDVGASFFEHAPQHEAMTFQRPPAEVLATAQAVLKRKGYRSVTTDDGVVHLYADKNRWAPWAGLVAHASIVVILAGAIVGNAFGFRDSQFMLAEGASSAVPGVPGALITLNSFKDTYSTTTGAPLDYVSDVTVTRDGETVVANHQLRVNDPLRYEGVSFYQAFFGPAAVMTVKDAEGNVLHEGGVPLAWTLNEGGNKVGSFNLPVERDLTAWVVGPTGPADAAIKPGQVAVELYRSSTGDAVTQQTIDQGAATEIEGLTFVFEREAKFTGLSVANDPGTPLVWLGCFLLIAGFVIRLYVPFRRLWGRLEARPDGGTALAIAAVGRRDTALENEFTDLVTDIRQAVVGQAKS
jgi:cytochrome c biogenesis protein